MIHNTTVTILLFALTSGEYEKRKKATAVRQSKIVG
jgi:hypothetical protein